APSRFTWVIYSASDRSPSVNKTTGESRRLQLPGRLLETYVCNVMDTIKCFDYRKPYANCILAQILALAFLLLPLPVLAQHDPRLLQIAAFPDQQVTGISVAPDGRIFVNFPYWSDQHSVSVAQLGKKSALTPYPDSSWNSEGGSLGF